MKKSTSTGLEQALVKIARVLYDYTASQQDAEEMRRLQPIAVELDKLMVHHFDTTGRLHPDVCYELEEWATLKSELQRLSDKQVAAHFAYLPQAVENHQKNAQAILEKLEEETASPVA